MASTNVAKRKDPPEIIIDQRNKRTYQRSRFLGKGGFAKCYELIDQATKERFAGKVVPKAALVKSSQKEKMQQEINIHRTLKHPNIVGFHGYFEDADFIYIVLELCNLRSLLELHKCRRYITEPEARYFLKQIIIGCQYLHKNKVIHRDLKLANLFLSGDMVVKIGDFGLASRIVHEGEKKKTLCGTPNYIAPEVLTKGGHSFEVDCWSLGCILYTLLVGSPPFETNKLEETYHRIKHNDYKIPYKILPSASSLIAALLNPDPQKRPNMFTILDHEFFKEYIPPCLPTSALSTCPRFENDEQLLREKRALLEPNYIKDTPISSGGGSVPKLGNGDHHPEDYWLNTLKREIQTLLATAKILDEANAKAMEESESPSCCPVYWVSKWVDYSDKYGLGYQLCDNSSGVVFNDVTRLILAANLEHFQYIDNEGTEIFFTVGNRPDNLAKKVTLLNYFKIYMHENLLKAGENATRREADNMARLPFLRRWFRTNSAIVLHLSNGTLQINFFEDHVKLILCPLLCAVTYIDSNRSFHTYEFKLLAESGIIADLRGRLNYAIAMIDQLNAPLLQTTGTKSNPYEAPPKGSGSTSAVARKATAPSAKGPAAASKPSS